jgi:hypothetical protein
VYFCCEIASKIAAEVKHFESAMQQLYDSQFHAIFSKIRAVKSVLKALPFESTAAPEIWNIQTVEMV